MNNEQNRHDISDAAWAVLSPLLPGQRGQWGGVALDNRRFINGLFWKLRTGSPWRDLPPQYGKWETAYQRFRRWCKRGVWGRILADLSASADFEFLMIDASHCKAHPDACGARGGNQAVGRTKGGSTRKPT